MKTIYIISFFFIVGGVISCIPPILHTADVSPGYSLTVGAGALLYDYWFPGVLSDVHHVGLVPSFMLNGRVVFKKWENTAFFVNLGYTTVAYEPTGGSLFPSPRKCIELPQTASSKSPLPNGALGVQWELKEDPSIALRVSAEYPSVLSLALLTGICSRKSKREIVTFGVKTPFFIYPPSVFIIIHPLSRLHFAFSGTWLGGTEYAAQAGIGISILQE